MFEVIQEFENEMEAPMNIDAAEYRRVLAVVDDASDSQMPLTMVKLSKAMKPKLFHLICLYKLVDVLHAVHRHVDVLGRNPRYLRMESIGILQSNKVRRAFEPLLFPKVNVGLYLALAYVGLEG